MATQIYRTEIGGVKMQRDDSDILIFCWQNYSVSMSKNPVCLTTLEQISCTKFCQNLPTLSSVFTWMKGYTEGNFWHTEFLRLVKKWKQYSHHWLESKNMCYRKADSSNDTSYVVSSLQWLLIVECLRPQAMETISVTARFCRLSTVFLAGEIAS